MSRRRRTLGYRLFRLGCVPPRLRAALDAEGVRWLDEGILVAVTLRGFRAPGRRATWRRRIGSGSVALTADRLVVCQYCWPILNIRLDDPRILELEWTSPRDGLLTFRLSAETFLGAASGQVEVRLRTPDAAWIATELARCTVTVSARPTT